MKRWFLKIMDCKDGKDMYVSTYFALVEEQSRALTFETKEDAVNFIIKEPLFVNINKTENLLPFLLSDISIDSVHITKIEEIIYKNMAQINFDKTLKKLKR